MTPRRHLLKTAAAWWAGLSPWASSLASPEQPFYPPAKPRRLAFPKDHGAHPEFRTEWWYVTGWLGQGASAMGFQLTFFRSRTQHAPENPSRLAPTQLLFAHAAITAPKPHGFLHANRAGRLNGSSLRADASDTHLQFDDWSLRRVQGELGGQLHQSGQRDRQAIAEVYEGRFSGQGFAMTFEASTQQPALLRGRDGFSAKGPQALQASHYYSRAPLRVRAHVQLGQHMQDVQGTAWLDHEWSSQVLMPGAVGWDWLGINLLDGGTLMAFQIRNDTSEPLYAHVDARDTLGRPAPGWRGLRWQPSGRWKSPALIEYPIPMDLVVGDQRFRLVPLQLAQEVDARASTGGFYWEGAVSLMQGDRLLGHGYLELTGYGGPVRF